ncbi:DUF2306 domain-containing protein [Apibacter raozihei]|uniref:DUF2306 domain-containing protein n=1 Tax=Apibacter raozihei TaxID=2500547 RepID=UPI000FE3A17E|nr:DUF2306 domain-containing protein [Apibacter raozihei]
MRYFANVIKILSLAVLGYYTILLLKISVQYFTFDQDVGFLRIKQDYLHIKIWKTAFYIHVFTSFISVFAGFTQFSGFLTRKYPRVHRYLGYVYIIDVLVFAAPSGLVMSFYANGGLISILAFITLSVAWWWTTYKAFILAKRRNIKSHKNYMIRSYALTLSAITLRLWKVIIFSCWDLPPMDVYRLISWLGFGINGIIAEIIIKIKK